MNANEIRFYLHSYSKLEKEIQHLKESLSEYRKMNISGIKAQAITDMPITHGSPNEEGDTYHSKTEQMAVTRLDYIRGLEGDIDSKMRLLNAINSVYFYLQDPARSIIELRYFVTKNPDDIRQIKYNWQEIAEEVNYSEDYCKEIDGKIIRQIQERYLKNINPHCTHFFGYRDIV